MESFECARLDAYFAKIAAQFAPRREGRVVPGHPPAAGAAQLRPRGRLPLQAAGGAAQAEVHDPLPKFRDVERASSGEVGRGLWEVGRLGGALTWHLCELGGKAVTHDAGTGAGMSTLLARTPAWCALTGPESK